MTDIQTRQVDWYTNQFKQTLKNKIQDLNFVGKIIFEVNVKEGGVSNMNLNPGIESVRMP